MGQPQIIKKLGIHLGLHTPPTEECHVLYLLAEIRKFLEQGKPDARYSVLEFYGNWCVHPLLDRKSPFITQITPDILKCIQECITLNEPIEKGSYLAKFLSLEHVKQVLKVFLIENKLPTEITVGANWETFRTMLLGILSEQPFEEPKQCRFQIVYDKFVNGDGVVIFPAGQLPFSQKDIT